MDAIFLPCLLAIRDDRPVRPLFRHFIGYIMLEKKMEVHGFKKKTFILISVPTQSKIQISQQVMQNILKYLSASLVTRTTFALYQLAVNTQLFQPCSWITDPQTITNTISDCSSHLIMMQSEYIQYVGLLKLLHWNLAFKMIVVYGELSYVLIERLICL